MNLPISIRTVVGLGAIWVPILYCAPPPLMLASWIFTIYNDYSIRQCLKEDEDKSAIADMLAGNVRVVIYISIATLIPTFIVGLIIVTTRSDNYFAIAGGAGMIAVFVDTVRLAFLPKEKMQSFVRRVLTAQKNPK